MTTFLKAALAVSLFSTPFCLIGCADDGCNIYPTDARCKTVPTSDITLLTSRLSKSGAGGHLKVRVKNLAMSERVSAMLGQGGPVVMFTQNADGSADANVSAAMLSNIPPGPLLVTVQAGQKSLTQTVHVYVPPSFADTSKISTSTGTRQPTWVKIGQGDAFAALDGPNDRRILQYHVSGTTITTPAVPEALTNTVPLGTPVEVTDVQAVHVSLAGNGMYSLETSRFSDQTTAYKLLKTLSYAKPWAVAADRLSSLVAVAGEGPDGPLSIFTLPPAGQQTAVVALNGAPSGKQPVRLGWGLIDNDTTQDLIAVHADNSIAIYLQKSAQSFTYDANLSTALQSLATLEGTTISALAVGDVDRDGLDDVIVVRDLQVAQLANEGDGTFSKVTLLPSSVGDAAAVGDVTGDGKPDLVLADKNGTVLSIYPNLAP